MSKKPETVANESSAVIDLEEAILVKQLGEEAGKAEYAKRRAAHPDGIVRKVTKLTPEQRAEIGAAKFVTVAELSKYYGVSLTTIANIRKAVAEKR